MKRRFGGGKSYRRLTDGLRWNYASDSRNASTSRRDGAEACAPARVTEIAAAAFAKRSACAMGAPSASDTASAALNVSPAAVVSRTSTGSRQYALASFHRATGNPDRRASRSRSSAPCAAALPPFRWPRRARHAPAGGPAGRALRSHSASGYRRCASSSGEQWLRRAPDRASWSALPAAPVPAHLPPCPVASPVGTAPGARREKPAAWPPHRPPPARHSPPQATTIEFCPARSTEISATPVACVLVACTAVTSTPAAARLAFR